MYREKIKVLDCTIRDGGLINNYQFTDKFVEAVYAAACDAGVDYFEFGKKLIESEAYPRDVWGKWNFCDDDVVQQVIDSHECENPPKIAVMYDVGRIDISLLKEIDQSPFDMIRVACYVGDIDKGVDLVKRCKSLGYETTLN
ncbi:MAG: nucleoid-structuring protein H-NS, partial [Deltaproteobacteria bacterium]|nr:nucleoid-structuring protein H-NS [Deltaproteobacteria bacterium]